MFYIFFFFFSILVYDLLTGEIVLNIRGHKGCVRDVSWHPYNHNIYTSSVSKSLQRYLSYISKNKKKLQLSLKINRQNNENVFCNFIFSFSRHLHKTYRYNTCMMI